MYLISTTHSSLISYTFVFWRCICPRLPPLPYGNITGGCLALHRSRIFWKSCWLQPKVHPLLTGSSYVSLSPRKWSSQKTATVLFQLKMIRSKRKRHKRTLPLTFWSNFFHALFICPRVFLPRFYLRERTCNAGMRLSKYTGKIYLPIK